MPALEIGVAKDAIQKPGESQMITKGQTVKINGKKVVVDAVDFSKFGRMVYYYMGGAYLWSYEHEIIG